MKIIIDARMLTDKLHGIARFLFELLRVFQEKKAPHRFTLLTNNPEHLENFSFSGYYEFVKVKSTPFSPGELLEIPRVLKKIPGDLYLAPTVSVPPYRVKPAIIVIHDLIPYHLDKSLKKKIYFKTVLKNAAQYALKIITPSEYTKNDVTQVLGCPGGKISVIYEGSNPVPVKRMEWEKIREKFGVKKPYVFSMGNPRPHKNMKGLIEIFNLVRRKCSLDLNLVFCCKPSEEIDDKIRSSPCAGQIKRIDYVSDLELDALYSNCEVFAYPSLFEGFGLPPLEAMDRGRPVVSSGLTSLGEVVGEGGIQADPGNVEEFSDEIVKLLESKDLQEEYIKKGRLQAGKFSWEKCADEILNIFDEVSTGL